MNEQEMNICLLDEAQDVPLAYELFGTRETENAVIAIQLQEYALECNKLVQRKRMIRIVKKANPGYKVSRKWLRGQLLATGVFSARSVEHALDKIRKGMGYKAYWQKWAPMIAWDQVAYRENCRRKNQMISSGLHHRCAEDGMAVVFDRLLVLSNA